MNDVARPMPLTDARSPGVFGLGCAPVLARLNLLRDLLLPGQGR